MIRCTNKVKKLRKNKIIITTKAVWFQKLNDITALKIKIFYSCTLNTIFSISIDVLASSHGLGG